MIKQSEREYLVSPGDELSRVLFELLNDQKYKFYDKIHPEIISVVDFDQPITPEIAAKLEPLGKPAAYWLELERKYQEDREKLSGISRWRRVKDQPPPKDGKSFFARKKLKDGSYDVFKSWWCVIKSEPDKTGWYHPIFNYGKPDGIFDEWCPIPA